jgi:acyl-CoA synthetase (NDP forming)
VGAKFGILPAVDENVDAGVEHEEEVGDVRQDLAPAQKRCRRQRLLVVKK